ncbi:helix-turn-helix domain-containing protein [Sphaerimonospora thailandensis]|uniref:HTH cro/C1-type domain-containing protein n=1 Tax=Sphaerimonospora thailandensis TaxID=795644 RepID=A0A8J3R5Q1_9ACTN|nr:helix-turn-helix transcriptional regulator [Sphaerimonospora thailandensis]GIH68978.1 hypothetical protein Mth01_12310 [Sphaerimonospora thailandensis]
MDRHLADLLGIDPDDPEVQREDAAIERDMRLIEELVQIRRAKGITQAQVAERIGRSQPAVSEFERVGGDPHLSSIRRYALAIGAEVRHVVYVSTAETTPTLAPPSLQFELQSDDSFTYAEVGATVASSSAVKFLQRSA